MMPPKNKIKIVDVVDKEIKNDDDYTITVDEIEKSELPAENTPLEATEETTTNIKKKDDTTPEEVTTDTIATESTNKNKKSRTRKM